MHLATASTSDEMVGTTTRVFSEYDGETHEEMDSAVDLVPNRSWGIEILRKSDRPDMLAENNLRRKDIFFTFRA